MLNKANELKDKTIDTRRRESETPSIVVEHKYDYSDIRDPRVKEKLISYEVEIHERFNKCHTRIGQILLEAKSNYEREFLKWVEGIGIHRRTAQKLIKRYRFYCSLDPVRKRIFDLLPLSLSYELSRGETPSHLLIEVLEEKTITSLKEYRLKLNAYSKYTNQLERIGTVPVVTQSIEVPGDSHTDLTDSLTKGSIKKIERKKSSKDPIGRTKTVVQAYDEKLILINTELTAKQKQAVAIKNTLDNIIIEIGQLKKLREDLALSKEETEEN